MKKQGFTLIELLAVIVILAIIALIAVPIILDLIGNTKVSAVKRSAENYIDAVELYLVRSELDTNKVTLERENKYNVTNSTTIGEKTYPKINDLVEISGSKPTGSDDYVQLNEKGKVIDAKLTIGGYEVEIKDGKITSVKGGAVIPLESISLNYTEQTMEKGSTFKLIPTFAPSNASNQEVAYESNGKSIVTVDSQGNVTAVNTGIAKITVTSKENPNIKSECNITVVVSATGLTITPTILEIKIGDTVQLVGTISPSNVTTNSLSWNSSDADIASVDENGLVTGVSVGEVTITATTLNGIKATSQVTVKALYKDNTNASMPELYNNSLTPVIYLDNAWKVADTSKKWYDYEQQEWANAVVLKNGVVKDIGDIINVSSEVYGMFVWIPKYEYKYTNLGTQYAGGDIQYPGEISIEFIPVSQNISSNDNYKIHPAFDFGETKLSGIWVGKFETTGTQEEPTVLPDASSLRSQKVNEQFITAQKFNTYINNNNIDFHMVKNSEWGAVAYLSQSKYGKYGNNEYSKDNKEIYINNSSRYITGTSMGAPSGTSSASEYSYRYSNVTNNGVGKGQCGPGASTTGNITGIYDMSGGAWEYVMGVYNKTVGSSGFNKFSIEKYYDNYTRNDYRTACNGETCYGHATSETALWYHDENSSVDSSYPWTMRGNTYKGGRGSGIFSFAISNGSGGELVSFRIALTLK